MTKRLIAYGRVRIAISSMILLNSFAYQVSSAALANNDNAPALVEEEPKAAVEHFSSEVEVDSAKASKPVSDKQISDKAIPDKAIPDKAISDRQIYDSSLTVDTIKVEGNRLVSAEDILEVVKTKPGDKFSRDAVLEDLKAINGLGYFDERNLQVLPELNGNGVLLKIRVTENAPITQFAFPVTKFWIARK